MHLSDSVQRGAEGVKGATGAAGDTQVGSGLNLAVTVTAGVTIIMAVGAVATGVKDKWGRRYLRCSKWGHWC